MESNEIEEMLKSRNIVIWKPEAGSIIVGVFQGIDARNYGSNVVYYYMIKSKDTMYYVKQYGWLLKHWSDDIKIGDDVGIRCRGYFDNGPSRRGYVFDLLWGHKIEGQEGKFEWRWL